MPELPEVSEFKSYFQSTALHKPIVRTRVRDDRCLGKETSAAKLARRLKHHSFQRVRRYGKWLAIDIGDAQVLALHFGMTGQLDYTSTDKPLPDYARIVWIFEEDYRLAYLSKRMLGQVCLYPDISQFIEDQDLGPDALDEQIDGAWFGKHLEGRGRQLKSLLMDQSFIAGIGNVYADEVLYQAGLMPSLKASELSRQEARHLFSVMRRVLQTAAKHGGNIDSLPTRYLLPHREGDRRCGRCGAELKERSLAGRQTVYCPHCQNK